MSTWLSGGLNQFSSLTDQITSFTKEVLTETTEEVTDPSAELQVLRQKYREIEKAHQYLQTEFEKLKQNSDEHNERAETAEYQISTISQEYRKLLESRDAEIRRLKIEKEKFQEQAKGIVCGSNTHDLNSPLKELAQFHLSGSDTVSNSGVNYESVDIEGGEEWVGQYNDDFSDIISSQAEINQLRLEMSKVRMESQHWKTMAEDKNMVNVDDEDTLGLREQIKSLQLTLQKEVEEHQQELLSLQTAHQQRIQSLTHRHQQEVGQLQEQVNLLQQRRVQAQDYTGVVIEAGQHRTSELEELNSVLLSQLNQLKSEYRKGQAELMKKLEIEQASTSILKGSISNLTDRLNQEKLSQDHLLKEEKEKHLNEMQAKIVEHQNSISIMQCSHQKAEKEFSQLQQQVETLTSQLHNKDREIDVLKEELQLQEERSGIMEDENLKEMLKKYKEKTNIVVKELAIVKEELHQSKIEEEALRVKYSQMEANTGNFRPSTEVETSRTNFKGLLSAKESEIKSLTDSMERTKREHKVAIDRMLADNREVTKQLELLRLESATIKASNSVLEEKLQALEEERAAMTKEDQRLQQENMKHSKQLGNLRAHLIEIQEQHTRETLIANQREAELKQQLADTHDKLTKYKTSLNEQLQAMSEERNDALLKMTNAQEQAKLNAESLKNLQTVLEQFQRDQSSELGQALKKSQLELADAVSECQQMRVECESLQAQLEEASTAAETASILNSELEEKEAKVIQLSQEVEGLQASLKDNQCTIEKLSQEDRAQVDRDLVKNMVLGYVHATERKKPEVLHLIAKILEFSAEELEQAVGSGSGRGGWLSGLWQSTPTPVPQPEGSASLSQLFIKFLESESSPKNQSNPRPIPVVAGYIDPHTDPDRPSLSTISLLGSAPLNSNHISVNEHQDTREKSKHGQDESGTLKPSSTQVEFHVDSTQPHNTPASSNSFQSSLLKNVLAD